MDNLTAERVEVDMIKFSGPAFEGRQSAHGPRIGPARVGQRRYVHGRRRGRDAAEVLYKKTILGRARQLSSRDQGDAGHARMRAIAVLQEPPCRVSRSWC